MAELSSEGLGPSIWNTTSCSSGSCIVLSSGSSPWNRGLNPSFDFTRLATSNDSDGGEGEGGKTLGYWVRVVRVKWSW